MPPTAEPLSEEQEKLLQYLRGVKAALSLKSCQEWRKVFGETSWLTHKDRLETRLSVLECDREEEIALHFGSLPLPSREEWNDVLRVFRMEEQLTALTLALYAPGRPEVKEVESGADAASDLLDSDDDSMGGYLPPSERPQSGSEESSRAPSAQTDHKSDRPLSGPTGVKKRRKIKYAPQFRPSHSAWPDLPSLGSLSSRKASEVESSAPSHVQSIVPETAYTKRSNSDAESA